MEVLEKVKPTECKIKIHGEEREIKFNFKAWAILEDEYKGIKNIGNIEKDITERPFHVVPHLLYIGLVNKEGVTEENILDEYGLGDIKYISDVLYRALYGSLPKEKKITIKKTEVK